MKIGYKYNLEKKWRLKKDKGSEKYRKVNESKFY